MLFSSENGKRSRWLLYWLLFVAVCLLVVEKYNRPSVRQQREEALGRAAQAYREAERWAASVADSPLKAELNRTSLQFRLIEKMLSEFSPTAREIQEAEARLQELRRTYVTARAGELGLPEIVKNDCEKLVDGQLLFEPSKAMRQGKPYPVFARLSRNPKVDLSEGLKGSTFVIVTERVSCKVSMSLDSEEPSAFVVDKQPAGRRDDQVLEQDSFSQWDWRVTPRKHGMLHLLLYVTPMLYVDGIGEQLKEFKQPPRIITVSPDYWYEFTAFVGEHWAIISVLLTGVLIPLLLWSRKGIMEWLRKRFKKKDVFYPLPTKESR